MDIVALAWGGPIRKAATTLTAIAAAIVAVPPAWSMLGLPEPATRHFVHEQVHPLQLAQNQTTQAVDRLIKSQLENQLYQAQQDHAVNSSPIVQQRVQELKQQIDETQRRINATTGGGK